jgi:hypothetical protein
MALGSIEDWRFTTSDTTPMRVNKLEAARAAILSLLSVNEGGLKGRLSDVLQNPGFWLPENVPALTHGSLVPVEGEGEVLQTQGAIALAPHAWEKVEGGRYYEGFWRFRVVKNDPLGEAVAPETGFFIYDAYGSYIGAHGTTTRATVTVASGWQDYFDTTTGAAIKTEYPAAAYVRPALMRGDEGVAISQVSRFRITDVTDITLLANDVTLRFIEERNLWQDADTAIYTEISGIELSMGDAIASITEEIELLVSADEAMALQIVTISAEIDDAQAAITTTSEALATLDDAFAAYTLEVDASIGDIEADITTTATALATLEGAFSDYTIEVDASIGAIESTVSIHASALTTLEGYAEARLELVAVTGGGRAQLTLHADANGGGGVDIVGDVSIDGDLLVTGSINGSDKIQPETVTTGTIAPNAMSSFSSYSYNYGGFDLDWMGGANDVWTPLYNGSVYAEVSVSVPDIDGTTVIIDASSVLGRGGSDSDQVYFRIRRTNDNKILSPVPRCTVGTSGDLDNHFFKFFDDDPIQNTTNTYVYELNSEDQRTPVYYALVFGQIFKR